MTTTAEEKEAARRLSNREASRRYRETHPRKRRDAREVACECTSCGAALVRAYNAASRAKCAQCESEQRRERQKARRQAWRAANPRKRTGAPWLNGGGYPMLYRPGHPNASSVGAIAAHRWTMAEAIGRPLLPGETVHHVNGDKLDYSMPNLELWCSVHPAGQRVSDLVEFARDILARYGDMA